MALVRIILSTACYCILKNRVLKKRQTKIHPLIENAVKLALHNYKVQYPSFEPHIETIFDPHILYIYSRTTPSLSQAFVFILDNAFWALNEKLKTNPDFKAFISITTQKKENSVIISFFDNGIGIPEKNITKVFEPFFTSRPTGFGNIGLGLSICYDIITKQHKGSF